MRSEFMGRVQQAIDQILDEGAVTEENVFNGLEGYVKQLVGIEDAEQRRRACVTLAALAFLGFAAQ